jgi:hypothetical protein
MIAKAVKTEGNQAITDRKLDATSHLRWESLLHAETHGHPEKVS